MARRTVSQFSVVTSALPAVLSALGVVGSVGVEGCRPRDAAEAEAPAPSAAPTASSPGTAAAPSKEALQPSPPAPLASAPPAAEPADASVPEIPRIGALFMETPIMSEMELPGEEKPVRNRNRREGAIRLGYMRQGATAPVIPVPRISASCPEGWYELVAGGFVCGKYATVDLNHPRVRLGPHAPYLEAALPYDYGYNLTNGTPLYRQVPSKKERLAYEPWLLGRPKPKPRVATDEGADGPDGGAGATLTGLAVGTAREPLGLGIDEDAGIPWFFRDFDGGKPQVTLDELRGDGPMARRMVRGFFVALDRDVEANNLKWWRTTGGLLTPHDRILVHKPPTDFHGIWVKDNAPPWPAPLTGDSSESRAKKAPAVLDAGAGASTATGPGTDDLALDGGVGDASGRVSNGTAAVAPQILPFDPERRRKGLGGPIAFVTGFKARKYTRSADRRRIVAGEVLTRRTAIPLLGEAANIGGTIYEQAEAGYWVKATDIVATQPGPPPTDLAPKEKWIDVNLTSQTLVAFEGTVPVFATLVSSGKKNEEDPEKDHRTPPGSYRIWAKHVAATMDGDVASDGPYSIEDVPWIMYFQGSYALHGAFWHASFGQERSHGCVNLSPADARALFGWTDPPLPEGWHGIRSTDANPGTRVVVHE